MAEQPINSPEEAEASAPEAQGAPESPEAAALAHAVARYRELVASAPGLVPEMVQGATVEDVDASAQAARQAYEQISRRIVESFEAQVPAGNPPRSASGGAAAALKPEDKIALGLRGK